MYYERLNTILREMKENSEIEGDITLGKICVIARNRYILKHLEEILNNEGIQYYFNRGKDMVRFQVTVKMSCWHRCKT